MRFSSHHRLEHFAIEGGEPPDSVMTRIAGSAIRRAVTLAAAVLDTIPCRVEIAAVFSEREWTFSFPFKYSLFGLPSLQMRANLHFVSSLGQAFAS
jgi:hypothetical protein